MTKTNIEWTNKTWNPITGCTKISEWCKNCYAEVVTNKLSKMSNLKKYQKKFNQVDFYEEELNKPYTWKNWNLIFINSMGDVFHSDISDDNILKILDVVKDNPQHIFQVLTKREKRMLDFIRKYYNKINNINNIMFWITIENWERALDRFPIINYISYLWFKTFISFEPLIDKINFESIWKYKTDWFIIWWETWENAREMKKEWVEDIKEYANSNNIPFFFKQWWWKNKKENWSLLNWNEYKEYPSYLKNFLKKSWYS